MCTCISGGGFQLKAQSFIPLRYLLMVGQHMHIYVLLSSIKMHKSEYTSFERPLFLGSITFHQFGVVRTIVTNSDFKKKQTC